MIIITTHVRQQVQCNIGRDQEMSYFDQK